MEARTLLTFSSQSHGRLWVCQGGDTRPLASVTEPWALLGPEAQSWTLHNRPGAWLTHLRMVTMGCRRLSWRGAQGSFAGI